MLGDATTTPAFAPATFAPFAPMLARMLCRAMGLSAASQDSKDPVALGCRTSCADNASEVAASGSRLESFMLSRKQRNIRSWLFRPSFCTYFPSYSRALKLLHSFKVCSPELQEEYSDFLVVSLRVHWHLFFVKSSFDLASLIAPAAFCNTLQLT